MTKKLLKFFSKPVLKFKINYNFFKPWTWNWLKVKEGLTIGLLVLCIILIFLAIYFLAFFNDTTTEESAVQNDSEQTESDDCNTVGINLHGFLSGYISNDTLNDKGENAEDQVSSEDILLTIEDAEKDEKIKAIIVEVDSSGGFPVAAEEVATALKKAKKQTVAWIRESGLSAAYWSSTGADIIFASAVSDVGSIGVTYSYLDNYRKNLKDGYTFNSLSSGKFKDAGNPDKPLTAEERALIMRDASIANEYFIKTVAANRNLDIEKVRQLADGSSMLGDMALQNGLIDRIGGYYEVKDYLKDKIGEEPEICWY